MQCIPPEMRDTSTTTIFGDKHESLIGFNQKDEMILRPQYTCLGVAWTKKEGKLFLTYSHWGKLVKEIDEVVVLTRRVVSSIISKAYDPVGYAFAFTLSGKLALQEAWTMGGA